MSDRIKEEYRRHTILSALDAGKYKGRVWKGKQLLTELEGESIQDVLTQLKQYVDAQFVSKAAERQQPAKGEDYLAALRNILNDLTDGHLAMIKAHYLAPDRCITATQLAKSAGYSHYSAANLQYGFVGKALYEEIPMVIPKRDDGTPIYTFMLATAGNEDSSEDEWLWKMRPEVVYAIESLGLNS